MIDLTLVCEDGNSKLVEVVTVVDVYDEKQLVTHLVALLKFRCSSSGEILKLVGNITTYLCWQVFFCRFGSLGLVIKLNFCKSKLRQDFEAGVWSVFWLRISSLILVEILKLCLVQLLKLKFYGKADFWLRF